MIIYYVLQMSGPEADISYNVAWMGFWIFAEISLGIIVPCTLSIPKFIEAEGQRLRKGLCHIAKPFRSISVLDSFLRTTKSNSYNSITTTHDTATLPMTAMHDTGELDNRRYFGGVDHYVQANRPYGSQNGWSQIP